MKRKQLRTKHGTCASRKQLLSATPDPDEFQLNDKRSTVDAGREGYPTKELVR